MKRTNSIKITKYILDILNSNDKVKEMLGDNIFPIDAKLSTTFPFAVIQRGNISPSYLTKDVIPSDSVTLMITIVDTRYSKVTDIANEVRYALEKKQFIDEVDNIKITDISLSSARESLYNEAYIQQLNFAVTIE